MNTSPASVAAVATPLVQSLENAWRAIQELNPEVPDVVVTFGAGAVSRGLKLGHFAASVWSHEGNDVHELFVGGEGLQRGAQALMGTLLHEAGHALAEARGVKDTSRQGRYHNKNFKAIAEEMGIAVQHDAQLGWSTTTVPDSTAAKYAGAILDLDASITAYRKGFEFLFTGDPTTAGPRSGGGTVKVPTVPGGRTNSNNGVVAVCGCGRKIRISQSVLDLGGITCNVCGEEFAPKV
jgi:hypothetical protein